MKRYGVLIKSDNALRAESEDRFPITEATKQLKDRLADEGIKATLRQCRAALEEFGDRGEWHHVSKFANEVWYYDVNLALEKLCDEDFPQALLKTLASKCKAPKPERTANVMIEWTAWSGNGRLRKRKKRRWAGTARIKGDWIYFDNKRKKLSGNWISVTPISQTEANKHEQERQRQREIERQPFELVEEFVGQLSSDEMLKLWNANRKKANQRLRVAIGLRVEDPAYVEKLKWAWKVIHTQISIVETSGAAQEGEE